MSTVTAEPVYDRTTRTWRLAVPTTGQVIEAPERATVEAQYLAAIAPALARRVKHCAEAYPQLTDRARRAGLLVAAQQVQPAPAGAPGAQFARVKGSGYQESATGRVLALDWYAVVHVEAGYACDCIDYAEGSAPYVPALAGRICKHILAALLAGF